MGTSKKTIAVVVSAVVVVAVVAAVIIWQGNNSKKNQPAVAPPKTEQLSPAEQALGKNLTQQQIETFYVDKLKGIATGYEGQLNTLITEALAEYNQPNHPSLASLSTKYMAKGGDLEKKCDTEFSKMLQYFRKDLEKRHLSTALADKAQQEYNKKKAERKQQILAAAAKM